MGEPVSDAEQLALALRLVDANWPRPAEDAAAMVELLRLRPSARVLVRRFAALGSDPGSPEQPSPADEPDPAAVAVLADPGLRRRLAALVVDLSTHLTNFGYSSEARRYLLAAEQWVLEWSSEDGQDSWDHVRWRVQSALAWAEGLGGDPSDETLDQRRLRARDRLLPLVEQVPDRDSLRPTVLSRAARFTAGPDLEAGDLNAGERRDLHRRAFQLASEDGRPAAVYSSTAIRYVAFLRDRDDGRTEARRISLEAAGRLRERAPGSRPYLLVLAQAASLARTGAVTAEDWSTALDLRSEAVELARSWLHEALRWVPDEADGVHRTLASQLTNQTTLLLNVGRLEEARRSCDEAISLTEASEQEQPGSLGTRRANLADIEFAAGRYAEAVRLHLGAAELGRIVGSTRTASRLAGAVTAALLDGVPVDQVGALVEEMEREVPASRGFNAHRVVAARGLVAVAGGAPAEGLRLLEQAEELRARRRPGEHPDVLRLRALRVVALGLLEDRDEAGATRAGIRSALELQFPGVSHWIAALADRSIAPGS